MSAELHQRLRDKAARHGNDFDRKRKVAEHADELRLVDNAHELLCHRRDDLLTRQRAAASLDHRAVLGDFVSAVDVDRELVDRGELDDRDAVVLEALGGLYRAGNRTLDPVLDFGQRVDEIVGRRSAADTDKSVVDYVLDRLPRDESLLLVLRHFLRTGGRSVQTPSNASAANPIDSLRVG